MSFVAGTQYKNTLITKVVPLEELQATLIEATHLPTGASLIKILNKDDENLFSLSFKTWPTKSDGVAHILEHTVLCGSKKYPVKDPFFGMTRRSLNTYMNALTGGDFTCYPAATLIKKDFYNLLSIYLDSVFHPLLNPLSFMQEGHRLEFSEKDDIHSPLQYKGIVFNEMKGALGNKEARLSEEIMHALYPDITYGVNSGGDPKVIPELTYEELKEFHKTYYHPSHCTFFFYGNLPFEEQIDYLEEHAFKGVKPEKPLGVLPRQPRFTKERTRISYYPTTEEEESGEKSLVAFGYLTCSILEQEELLALNVLDILLMGTDASPLKMALLKSNLCKEVDGIIDNEMNDVPYIIVCKGCKEESHSQIQQLIDKTLHDIIKEGFSEEMIEGAIHQLEMARLEITGGSSPYGLSLFFRSILLKQHGGNPEDGLLIHSLFSRLRERNKESYLLLIKKYFLNNSHCVTIEMRPDEQLGPKEEEEELAQIKKRSETLSEKEKEEIVKKGQLLAAFQEEEEEEAFDCLPTLALEDVKKEEDSYPLEKSLHGSLTLYSHDCFTNHMIYVDVVTDLPSFTLDELFYVRLFCYLLPQVGAGGRTYKENLDFMLQHTGGLTAFFDLGQQVADPNLIKPFFCLRGKSLERKAEQFFTLIKETLTSADFTDKERIHEILIQHLSALESSIVRNPLRYGINLAASNFSIPSMITNHCYGLPYYWKLKKEMEIFEKDSSLLLAMLNKIKEKTLRLGEVDLVISGEKRMVEELKKKEFFGLPSICHPQKHLWESNFSCNQIHSHAREIPSPISFTTLLFPTISYKDERAAALTLASEIMENCVLHSLIREQGGAYGTGAVFTSLSAQFYFYTYRDPHIASSLEACKEAVASLCKGDFTVEDVRQAKLQTFQTLDTPPAPCSRGYTSYSRMRSGRTPEVRQRYRDHLFRATKEQIQETALTCLQEQLTQALVITFAGKELLEKELPLLESSLPKYSIEENHV